MTDTLIRIDAEGYEDGSVHLTAWHYPIVKRTRCGVWIELWRGGKRKFVNLESVKKWAHPTMDGAIESFRRRKHRHLQILRWQMKFSQLALARLESGAPIRETSL